MVGLEEGKCRSMTVDAFDELHEIPAARNIMRQF